MATVTIIGAGIVGACIASYLQRAGAKVRLVDSGKPGMGTSYGNAGGLSSGAFVPISYPGMIKQVPGWLLDKEGPLFVRAAYLPRALPWLVRFLREGRRDRYERNGAALRMLTLPLFDNLMPLARAAGAEHLIRRVGQLHLYSTDKAFAADAGGRALRRRHGVELQELGADEIRQMEPTLAPIFRHAVHFPAHGHCANPLGLTAALVGEIVRNGGELLEAQVRRIEVGPDGARALETSAGRIAIEELVIATGAWSRQLAADVGHRIPLETQRGYHAMVATPETGLRRNVQWTERKFIATPMADGVRFAGTVEIAGLAAAPDWRRAETLLKLGREMLPALGEGAVSRWMGHRPCLPDSLPVIGRSSRARNVTFAFGHGHIGLISAPTTGRLVSDIVLGRPPVIDPTPFSADRFA